MNTKTINEQLTFLSPFSSAVSSKSGWQDLIQFYLEQLLVVKPELDYIH